MQAFTDLLPTRPTKYLKHFILSLASNWFYKRLENLSKNLKPAMLG